MIEPAVSFGYSSRRRMLTLVSGSSRSSSSELCGRIPRHQREEFWFAFQPWLVEDFNGAIGRQMKQNRDCEFRRHVVQGFDDVGRALFDHAGGEERRIDHVVGLRHRIILDVKVGHDSHLRADDRRLISFGPCPVNKGNRGRTAGPVGWYWWGKSSQESACDPG